ncbi:GAF domain protein [Minicystis rosea]|nr:GAF domain protein [Minicystis rosea]
MKVRQPAPSDRPPEDLKKERDAFIQQFFRKGAQFTEELLKENERLREHIANLEHENGKLRAHLASDEAIRDLLRKIEELEREKQELLGRSARAEAVKDNFTAMYQEVEGELANFANLYVATAQLHAARSVRGVLRALKELLAQLLGAAAFAVYFISDDEEELVAIASEGVDAASVARLPAKRGAIGRAFASGEVTFDVARDVSRVAIDDPVALVPMHHDGRVHGIIVIFGTLPQKTEFVSIDRELFKLLGAQAAPALVNARLFTDAGRKVPGVQAFVDLED